MWVDSAKDGIKSEKFPGSKKLFQISSLNLREELWTLIVMKSWTKNSMTKLDLLTPLGSLIWRQFSYRVFPLYLNSKINILKMNLPCNIKERTLYYVSRHLWCRPMVIPKIIPWNTKEGRSFIKSRKLMIKLRSWLYVLQCLQSKGRIPYQTMYVKLSTLLLIYYETLHVFYFKIGIGIFIPVQKCYFKDFLIPIAAILMIWLEFIVAKFPFFWRT